MRTRQMQLQQAGKPALQGALAQQTCTRPLPANLLLLLCMHATPHATAAIGEAGGGGKDPHSHSHSHSCCPAPIRTFLRSCRELWMLSRISSCSGSTAGKAQRSTAQRSTAQHGLPTCPARQM